jgi:hypothetical protein
MRSRTTLVLRAAFSTAILAACREKTEAVPPPPPPTATPTSTPTTTSTVTRTSLPAGQTRFGQRCTGLLVPKLKPKPPVDYLELRLDYYSGRPEVHEIVSTGQTGTPCATAKDPAKCKTALDDAIPKGTSGGEYLVYTRGDDVGTVRGKDVVAFLGPVDGPEEAAMALVYPLTENTSTAAMLPDCDPAKFIKTNAGWETTWVRTGLCDERHETAYLIDAAGTTTVTKQTDVPPKPNCQRPFLGRRTDGVALSFDPGALPHGADRFFAECTEMEAASVHAFHRLDEELAALGAPRAHPLRRRARRSARDEARHARTMRSLARRFGPARARSRPASAAQGARSALALAIENAVEGCVFETWAAVVASFQAANAPDPVVRSAMRTVARDETRHAALARDVDRWLDGVLDADERAMVERARAAAVAELAERIANATDAPASLAALGLPSADAAKAVFSALRPIFSSR